MQVIIIRFKGVTNTLKKVMQMKNCLQHHKYPVTTVREGCAATTATRMEKEYPGSPTRTTTNRLMAEYAEKSLNLHG